MTTAYADRVGLAVPKAHLACLHDGMVETVAAAEAIGLERTLVMGLPGAFTPVCSRQHAPALVASADDIRATGFAQLVCILPNDPFVTAAWAEIVDPFGKVRFLSDGNLEFARALGFLTHAPELFLGERSERYLLIFEHGRIVTCRVEAALTDYACTNPNVVLLPV